MTDKEIAIVDDIFNHGWRDGWQLDLEYIKPRVVFHKKSSTCYMYDARDFDTHLRTCELTNLEYLEGQLFFQENYLLLHKKEKSNA